MREYETTVIVQPEISSEGTEAILRKMDGVLEQEGATRLMCTDLGKRKLAYEIAKFQKGHYYVLSFLDDGKVVSELERNLRIEESVLRFMTVKVLDEVVDVEARKGEARLAEIEQQKRAAEKVAREAEEAKARDEIERQAVEEARVKAAAEKAESAASEDSGSGAAEKAESAASEDSGSGAAEKAESGASEDSGSDDDSADSPEASVAEGEAAEDTGSDDKQDDGAAADDKGSDAASDAEKGDK